MARGGSKRTASRCAGGSLRKIKPARDPHYLDYIRAQPCAVCGRGPVDPHHVKLRGQSAMGRKPSDYCTAPLCRRCHRVLHDGHLREAEVRLVLEAAVRLLVAWMDQRHADLKEGIVASFPVTAEILGDALEGDG